MDKKDWLMFWSFWYVSCTVHCLGLYWGPQAPSEHVSFVIGICIFRLLFSLETRKIPWFRWTCPWLRRFGCRISRSSTWRRYIPNTKLVCPPIKKIRTQFSKYELPSSPPSTSFPSSRASGSTGTWSWSTLLLAGNPSFLPPLHYRLSP